MRPPPSSGMFLDVCLTRQPVVCWFMETLPVLCAWWQNSMSCLPVDRRRQHRSKHTHRPHDDRACIALHSTGRRSASCPCRGATGAGATCPRIAPDSTSWRRWSFGPWFAFRVVRPRRPPFLPAHPLPPTTPTLLLPTLRHQPPPINSYGHVSQLLILGCPADKFKVRRVPGDVKTVELDDDDEGEEAGRKKRVRWQTC